MTTFEQLEKARTMRTLLIQRYGGRPRSDCAFRLEVRTHPFLEQRPSLFLENHRFYPRGMRTAFVIRDQKRTWEIRGLISCSKCWNRSRARSDGRPFARAATHSTRTNRRASRPNGVCRVQT